LKTRELEALEAQLNDLVALVWDLARDF